ncbi:MAG: hypothetical protein AAF327_15870 [Cyanobacteria bacterium P01_A01_bin.37]
MITATQIKTNLSAELPLGTYTFSNASTTDAIRIETGASPFPEEPKVTGLEVVIQPSIDVPINLCQGGYQQTFTHLIVLKQWDIEKTTLDDMADAIAACMDLGLKPANPVRQPRRTELDNIETLRFTVSEDVFTPGDTF